MNGELEITGGCGVMEREKRGRRRRAGFLPGFLLLLWLREIAGKKKGVLVPEGSLNYCILVYRGSIVEPLCRYMLYAVSGRMYSILFIFLLGRLRVI